jgi:anti-sigma factor RsiW
MKCDGKWIEIMHKMLDDEATPLERIQLHYHLDKCSECKSHYNELKIVNTHLQEIRHIKAPKGFSTKVINGLPKEKRRTKTRRWFRQHPVLTAAALFFILFSGAILSEWNTTNSQPVSYVASGGNLQINNTESKVIVPQGEVVRGDLIVRNGDVEVEGKVQGDVVVINGQYLASAGSVAGDSEEIHQVTEWVWYKMKDTYKKMTSFFTS